MAKKTVVKESDLAKETAKQVAHQPPAKASPAPEKQKITEEKHSATIIQAYEIAQQLRLAEKIILSELSIKPLSTPSLRTTCARNIAIKLKNAGLI